MKIYKNSNRSKSKVTASISWESYNTPELDAINEKYLPSSGEGDNYSSQVVTAVNKLIYKWYNDGDVFDNTHGLTGWGNDLSSYANWLDKYTPAGQILEGIYKIFDESEYEDLLYDLADMLLDEAWLDQHADDPKVGSIYNCDGPFVFEEYSDDDYDEDGDSDWY